MNTKIKRLKDIISSVIVGKEKTIIDVIIALICGGHVLIEDVPGVGKTRLASALAKSLDGKFNRIQLTPDVMPSDITGFTLVNQQTHDFEYREGAAMCNFLLADEINRASPKVQSALLEAMEEFQLTVDGVTHKLPNPFMVLATQNPVETSGTYHLPEAQTDRFFMRVSMGYPSENEELLILDNNAKTRNITENAFSIDDILTMRKETEKINVDDKVKKYIISLVSAGRNSDEVTLGISPRGSIALYNAAKAHAYIYEREFVIPEDIKKLAPAVLSHRVILSSKGRGIYHNQGNYIEKLLGSVSVPI